MAQLDLFSLPYGYTSRFVDLMPIEVLEAFNKAGPDGVFFTKRRPLKTSNVLNAWSEKMVGDRTCYIVRENLNLNMNSVEDGDHVLNLIHGNYRLLAIQGCYSWRHAVQLTHEKVQYASYEKGIQVAENEFDEYVAAICKILMRQTINMYIMYMPDVLLEKLKTAIAKLPIEPQRIDVSYLHDDEWIVTAYHDK